MFTLLFATVLPRFAIAQCIDYGKYLHWAGIADLPGQAQGVAVSGNYVYVAARFSGFHVLDVSNPASPATALSFSLPTEQAARVAVYDVAGRMVRDIVNEELPEGDHAAIWDGRNARGQRVAGGTYFVRLHAGGETQTRKVVFLGD